MFGDFAVEIVFLNGPSAHLTRAGDGHVVDEGSALQTAKLPFLHKDPFDRLPIAQAIENSLILATPDPLIRQYAVRTIWE